MTDVPDDLVFGGFKHPVQGHGHDPGPGKVMRHERQERPDAVFVGKEVGRRHQGVFPEAVYGVGVNAHLTHDRLKVPDGHREGRWAPAKVVGAEDNDPPVILLGGQGEGAGDEVRGQQVMRHGQTGDAVGQGGAYGPVNGGQKRLSTLPRCCPFPWNKTFPADGHSFLIV